MTKVLTWLCAVLSPINAFSRNFISHFVSYCSGVIMSGLTKLPVGKNKREIQCQLAVTLFKTTGCAMRSCEVCFKKNLTLALK